MTGYPRRTAALRIIYRGHNKIQAGPKKVIHVKIVFFLARPRTGREEKLVPPLVFFFLTDESRLRYP